MQAADTPVPNAPVPPRFRLHAILGRILLHVVLLLVAAALFAAYQHFALHRQSTPSLLCLAGSAGCALAPLRALLGELFALERHVLHLAHGLGALLLAGLSLGGVISGGPVLTRAALAPFAVMGAAQALMHQDHPRNARQAEALQRFAGSLPEVAQLMQGGNLAAPQNAARAVAVLQDLLTRAQALGATELQADPGFQGALARVMTRSGLALGLDVADKAIDRLTAYPAAARAVPALRRQLAAARRLAEHPGHSPAVAAAIAAS
jgi:hypothetical protein